MTSFKKTAAQFFILFLSVLLGYSSGVLNAPHRERTDAVKVLILYDNYVHKEGTQSDWGFACLIEGTDKTILFDTGTKSDILWPNIQTLGIDVNRVEQMVISHIHGDHTGGLLSVLEKKKNIPVYIPGSSPDGFVKGIKESGGQPVKVLEPVEICKDVILSGEMGTSIREISLIIKAGKGIVLITGCAHPGIVDIVQRANEITGKSVHFVLGGFHLMNKSEDEVRQIIKSFKEMGVEKCGATHCTGEKAIQLFKEAYGENYVAMGVGRIIELPD